MTDPYDHVPDTNAAALQIVLFAAAYHRHEQDKLWSLMASLKGIVSGDPLSDVEFKVAVLGEY